MKKFFKITFMGTALGLVGLSSFPSIGQEKPALVNRCSSKGSGRSANG